MTKHTTALVSLAFLLTAGGVYAGDGMQHDSMAKGQMARDSMAKDTMSKPGSEKTTAEHQTDSEPASLVSHVNPPYDGTASCG